MSEVPDGYVRWPDPEVGPGLMMVDPQVCPSGHPFQFGHRGSLAKCREHRDHNMWRCACGQEIWRYDGAFVGGKPPCVG